MYLFVSVCSYDEVSAHLCICVIAANFLSPPRRWPSFANTAIGNQLFQWFTLLHKSSHQFGLVLTSCSIHAAGKKVFWYPTPFWWDPRKLTQAKLFNRPTSRRDICQNVYISRLWTIILYPKSVTRNILHFRTKQSKICRSNIDLLPEDSWTRSKLSNKLKTSEWL